jgi:hypothetical protein
MADEARIIAEIQRTAGKHCASSARDERRAVSGETMKREKRKGREAGRVDADEILPEYDSPSA